MLPSQFKLKKGLVSEPAGIGAYGQADGKEKGAASPLRMLRKQKGISQKDLAAQIGMERTRLVRLEQKPWGDVSMGDLEIISSALGVRLHELVLKYSGFGQEWLSDRIQLGHPCFKIDPGKGYRFGSALSKPEACFIGTLQIDPQKTVPAQDTPSADFLFFLVLEGDLLVTLSAKEYRMKERDSFTVAGTKPYEFYNPHQFKETLLLICAFPSFVKRA